MDERSCLCANNQGFMMKYMDNAVTGAEMASLKEHLALCESCRADFTAYKHMLAEFAVIELVEAPAGFELAVMAKIEILPDLHTGGDCRLDTLICMVSGSFCVVAGVGTLLFVNQESFMSWAGADPLLAACVGAAAPVAEAAADIFAHCAQLVNSGLSVFGDYAASLQLVLVGVFSALALAQFFMYRKEKVKAS